MANFEVWITIVLSLVMSLVRVEPKNILPYLLGFKVFSRIFSVDSFRSKFGMVPRRNHGHFILFYIFASRTRNSETNWLALQAAEIRGG